MQTTQPTQLTERQQQILNAVVAEHVRTAEPVGSQDLVEQYSFGVSPATVRNDMLALEQAGMLEQPHTSAGRIPTDLGYRTYVRRTLGSTAGFERRRSNIERRIARMQHHYDALARETVLLLAELTSSGAIASTGVRNSTAERAGLSNLIELPELKDDDIARAVAHVFDHPDEVLARFARTGTRPSLEVEVPGGAPVQVYIGSEAGLGRVPLAVLASAFPIGDGAQQGHLVVIGPSRMPYQRNVALLSYLSRMLGQAVRHATRGSGKYLALVALVLPTGLIISHLPTHLA
ncbi:MAG: DeoR family transcriptional regulator [Candidatus Andersenbacteria bacterium]